MKDTNIFLLFDNCVGIDKVHDVLWINMVKHLQVGVMSRVVVVV